MTDTELLHAAEAELAAIRQGITAAEKPDGDTSDVLDLVQVFIAHHKQVGGT